MAEDLSTPSNTLVKVRWKEPYVSEGLNKKLNGLIPSGVIRGGKLGTSGVNSSVTVEVDSETGDSIYSFIDSNGIQLTFRQVGNVTLDLDVGALPGTTVYVGLEITYSTSSDTVVKWRGYSQAEVDADSTIVVLGSADVPGVAALIPASDISDDRRRTAWQSISQYMRDARQVVENGDFSYAVLGEGIVETDGVPWWKLILQSIDALWGVFTTGSPAVGRNHLRLRTTGDASQVTTLRHQNLFSVRGGSTVRVSFKIQGDTLTPGPGSGGHMGVMVNVYGDGYSSLLQTEYIEDLTLSGTWAYTEVTRVFKLDDDATFVELSLHYDDDSNSSTGNVYFDDVRCWVEQPGVLEGTVEGYGDLVKGMLPVRDLAIAPRLVGSTDLESFILDFLRIAHGSSGEWDFEYQGGVTDFLLNLTKGGLNVENLLTLGSNKISSDALAGLPRITSTFRDGVTGTTYTLLWELQNSSGSEAFLRVYATGSSYPVGGSAAFVIVANASFDSSTDTWSRDEANDAWRLDVGSGRIVASVRLSTETDGWADAGWSDTASDGHKPFELLQQAVNLREQATLGLDIQDTTTNRAIPRLEVDLNGAGANSYTCIAKLDSTTGTDDVYLYGVFDADSTLTGSQTEFCVVCNAVWNGTQWSEIDTGITPMKFSFSPSGFAVYRRGTSDASTWADSDWEDLNGRAAIEAFIGGAVDTSYASLKLADGKIYLGNQRPTAQTNPDWDNNFIEKNTLYSKNIVKAWARVTVTGASGSKVPTVLDGLGWATSGITLNANGRLELDFDNAMDSGYAAVSTSRVGLPDVFFSNWDMFTGTLEITAIDSNAGTAIDMDADSNLYDVSVIVLGGQS